MTAARGAWMLPHYKNADLLKRWCDCGRSCAEHWRGSGNEPLTKREGGGGGGQQLKAKAKRQRKIRGCGSFLSSPVRSFIQGIRVPKRDGCCSLYRPCWDESHNSPVPWCHGDQYQLEWAAEARPLSRPECRRHHNSISDSTLIGCWNNVDRSTSLLRRDLTRDVF